MDGHSIAEYINYYYCTSLDVVIILVVWRSISGQLSYTGLGTVFEVGLNNEWASYVDWGSRTHLPQRQAAVALGQGHHLHPR